MRRLWWPFDWYTANIPRRKILVEDYEIIARKMELSSILLQVDVVTLSSLGHHCALHKLEVDTDSCLLARSVPHVCQTVN
jgi:hypothetical protein